MEIFVGCSSMKDIPKKYEEQVNKLAKLLIERKHNLVFGGCADGLMGIIYKEFRKSNAKITVVKPEPYKEYIKGLEYDKLYMIETVSKEKEKIIDISDAFIFLPGGIGTIDEIFTILEEKRSKRHNKPIVIVNDNGYYNGIIDQMELIYKEKFAIEGNRELYHIVNNANEAIEYIEKLSR